MSKKKAEQKRSCNQCSKPMLRLLALKFTPDELRKELDIISVCNNPACPNYALLQVSAEQMPTERTPLGLPLGSRRINPETGIPEVFVKVKRPKKGPMTLRKIKEIKKRMDKAQGIADFINKMPKEKKCR